MYFGVYKDYRTEYYVGEKEAVLDVVAYMEENNITDEFNVYKTIRIDAKEIINPLCEADILQLIQDHTKETYSEAYSEYAKNYLVTMGAGAYNHFRFMVNEFKTALVSFFKNYKLEPTWERIMSSYVYKYDTDKKTWKFIEEVKYEKPPIVEPSEPTPIEPEPVEPVEPEPVEPTPTDNPSDDNTGGNTENGDSGTTDNDNTSSGDSDTPSDVDNNNNGNSDTSGDTNSGNDDSNNTDNNVTDSNTDDNKNGDEP